MPVTDTNIVTIVKEKRKQALLTLQQLNSNGLIFQPFSNYSDIIEGLEEFYNQFSMLGNKITVFKNIGKKCIDKVVSIEKMEKDKIYNLDTTCINYKVNIYDSYSRVTKLNKDTTCIRNPYGIYDDFYLIRIRG